VLRVGTRRKRHFGQGQRRKQFNETTLTSVKNGIATGSAKQSLRIPKKSEVR